MVKDEGSSPVTSSPSPLHHFSLMPISPSTPLGGSPYPWLLHDLSSADRGLLLIHLLVNCATHVAARNFEAANAFLEHISLLVSPDGDAMQRVASYFTDALACRLLKSLPGVYRALHSTRPRLPSELLLARRHFFDLCPFLKLAAVVANGAIAEAMEGERMVHVIDLHAWDPAQWVALLHMLAARPEGPPHLRVTGVHEQKEVLDHVAARLTEEAERLDVPFQFNPVVARVESLDVDSLRVKTGEALAISSVVQLHQLLACDDDRRTSSTPTPTKGGGASPPAHLRQGTLGELLEKDHALLGNGYSRRSPDSSTTTTTSSESSPGSAKMEAFLGELWGLSPKVMVVAEQESNHNRPALSERFTEALNYYAALFDCLESTLARGSVERGRVERALLGEEIRNVIACEGKERRERHERAEKWGRRMEAAGFARVGIGADATYQARALLQGGVYGRCEGYRVREEGGCLMLCWQSHPLFSVSAWRCRRFD